MHDQRFSPVQGKILKVLSDGLPHLRKELHACLSDELAKIEALNVQLCAMRKHLRPLGQDIVCVFLNRRIAYQHVKLLAPPAGYPQLTAVRVGSGE